MNQFLAFGFSVLVALTPLAAFAQAPGGSAPGVPLPGRTQADPQTVRRVEQQLRAAGFNPGPVDGVMDQQTRDAIRRFQRATGLAVTGELDPRTRSTLRSSSGPGTPPQSLR